MLLGLGAVVFKLSLASPEDLLKCKFRGFTSDFL